MDVWLANVAVIAVLMVATWVLSLLRRDASIVDIAWGLAFVAVAWTTYIVGDGAQTRRVLLLVLTTIWGLRLAGYLAWRNLPHGEDRRYAAMRRRAGATFWWRSLFTVFALQGFLVWVVSSPVRIGQLEPEPLGLVPLDVVGIVLWAIGMTFETVGDAQLARFKRDPANAAAVMDRGLWRYTRHPNYFGDFMVWWGLYAIALSTGDAWWTIVGPLVMSLLLIRVSGAGLLEKTIGKRRPGYEDYVARTSAFFPRPPKEAGREPRVARP